MSASPPTPLDDTKATIKMNNICQVCGDNASIINYGVLTCLSCRTFFRRNGFYTKTVTPCKFDGNCEVNMLTRKTCTACRLAKCLAVGMSPDLIRKEELTGTKRKSTKPHSQELVEYKTTMSTLQTATLNFPSADSDSYLTSSEVNMISNVVYAFDTFSPVFEIRRTIETINTTASNKQFDLSQSLEIISSFLKSLQSFISSTPDFKVLTAAEQWSLFQRNILGLLSIGGIYFMRESGIFDKPENEMAVLPLYGNEIIQQVRRLSRQLDEDPIVIKLMLIALAFSSNCFIKPNSGSIDQDTLLFGTYRLFGSQNVYIELIWKYLLSRYNYIESVQRFSVLTKRFLDTIKLSIEIYENNEVFKKFIDDITEQIDKSPAILDATAIPLWGKKN